METDIRTLLGKLNPECKLALQRAAELCVQQTHYNVEVEHLLFQLIEAQAPDIFIILEEHNLKPDLIQLQLQDTLDRFKRGNGRTPALSPHIGPLVQQAWVLSTKVLDEQQVRSGSLLLAMLEE